MAYGYQGYGAYWAKAVRDGAAGGGAAVAGSSPTVLPIAPTVHYHPQSQAATLDGSNRVLSCPDIRGLAAASGLNFAGGTIGPVQMTDALGHKFWRFRDGTDALVIANALNALSARAVNVFMVVRKHNHKNGTTSFFSPRYSAYTDDVTNTAYSGGATLRTAVSASAASLMSGAGISAATDAANAAWMIPACNLQVIGIASRTTALGGQRMGINDKVANVAQSGVTSTSCTGGLIGGTPGASNGITFAGGFDLYEFPLIKGSLTNAEFDACMAALFANWALPSFSSQGVIDGDSILDGVLTSLPVIPTSGDNVGMLLTEPGSTHLPASMRVINQAVSGSQTSGAVTRRDAVNGMASYTLPGGAANNKFLVQLGANDCSETGGQKNSTMMYADMVALLNTTSTGWLQRGWSATVVANIARTATAVTTNLIAGEDTIQKRLEAVRILYADTVNKTVNPQFKTDTLTNTGQAFDGLLNVLHMYDVTVAGDTKFKTIADSGDTASGYYDSDSVHLRVAGLQLLVSGGDTPAYGLAAWA